MSESSSAESSPEEQNEEQPEEFLNRAARRAAKSKKHQHGQAVTQAAQQPHGRATVAGRRDYGNRRSG
jgi:hypothetical protein